MKLLTSIVALLSIAFLSGAEEQKRENKLPESALDILMKAEQFELLSLNPNEKEKVKDGFHGYPVLGKTTLKADMHKQVVEALTKGMAGDIVPARCFIPRHGIRATHDSKTVELVICFECSQFHLHEPGGKRTFLLISEAPAPVFNKVLKDAGIPIAK